MSGVGIDLFEILFVVDEIEAARIDGEHRTAVILREEEVIIGVVQFFDVAPFHLAFVWTVAQGDALHQRLGGRPQIDHQGRGRNLLGQGFVHPVVHFQFIALQIDAGEQRVFIESVIGDQIDAVGLGVWNHRALLAVAAE